MQEKDANLCGRCDPDNQRYCNKHDWEEYEELIEAKIIEMWKRKGITDRIWTRNKVIYFELLPDGSSVLKLEKLMKYKADE